MVFLPKSQLFEFFIPQSRSPRKVIKLMQYIVVTDLDGTLLDHQTYEFTPALKAIETLDRRQVPIILNSSKTQAEILAIRQQLNNQEPFVCENGGIICGLVDDTQVSKDEGLNVQYLATPREQFLASLAAIKEKLQLKYQGFADATVEDVVRWTGLTAADAQNAMNRSATEPLLWQDTELALESFRQELSKLDLQCVKGGRFHHVMGFFNKASCFARLKQYYAQIWQAEIEEVGIIALGDSPNDLPMLERADYAVVIPSAKGANLKPDRDSLYFATQPGPYGWQEAIDFLLQTIF